MYVYSARIAYIWIVYLSCTSNLPAMYLSCTSYVPAMYLPRTCLVLAMYQPCTCHVPATYLPRTCHVPAMYLPCTRAMTCSNTPATWGWSLIASQQTEYPTMAANWFSSDGARTQRCVYSRYNVRYNYYDHLSEVRRLSQDGALR